MKDKISVEMKDGTLWDIEDDDDILEAIEIFMGSEMSKVVSDYVEEQVAWALSAGKDKDTEGALHMEVIENNELRALLREICTELEDLPEAMKQVRLSKKRLREWANVLHNKICSTTCL